MKKIIAIILCAAALASAFASCSKQGTHHPDGVTIVDDAGKSFFSGVERVGNNAVITCHLTIENTTDKTAAVKLAASFPEEYRKKMYSIDFAVAKVDGSEMVAVPANDSVEVDAVFEVPFVSGYKGEALKVDRELPAIAINEIEIDSSLLPAME